MTGPHDRITTHPEYRRSYEHYIASGSTPEDAARLAYQWTEQHIPAPAPRQPMSRTTKLVFIGAAVVAVLAVAGLAAAVAMSPPSDDASSASSSGGDSGGALRDGAFEFDVNNIECGTTDLGPQHAQGKFCLVTVTVKNVKTRSATFSSSSQKAFGAGGAEYEADTVAGLYANEHGEAFLNDINPGNSVKAVVVFDIPASAKLTRIELHDSPFSGGAVVNVK